MAARSARERVARQLYKDLAAAVALIDPQVHDYSRATCDPEVEWQDYKRQIVRLVEQAIEEVKPDHGRAASVPLSGIATYGGPKLRMDVATLAPHYACLVCGAEPEEPCRPTVGAR